MQRNKTESNSGSIKVNSHAPQFTKAMDGRKRPIRGLWMATASGHYYAQLLIEDTDGQKKVRRVLLLDGDRRPVTTSPEAVKAMNRLKDQRDQNDLPVITRTPKFGDFVDTYLAFIKAGEGMKKPGTIEKEEGQLRGWTAHMGGVRLDQIRQANINAFVVKRKEAGFSERTTKLDVIGLRNVLNHAIDEGWIKVLPIPRSRRSKSHTGGDLKAKRELFAPADLDALCGAALAVNDDGSPVTKNGRELCDYLRVMAYTGTRRNEALALRWSDVDFDAGRLSVERQITSRGIESLKNGEPRTVDFNPKLKNLLAGMVKRRAPDTDWMFPSPQRGDKDVCARTFRESFDLARTHVIKEHPKLAGKAFHDLRHYFISFCVMSGIDYMTIAEWVGHRDGGVLIGKVYGHLANEHKKAMAQKLNFEPTIVEEVA